MTKAKRLELLKQIEKDIYVPSIESTFLDDTKSCAIHSAIEELEQKPKTDVIDKIRAEIEQVAEEENKHDEKWAKGLKYALKIIDKYKTESEVNNG